MQVARAVVNTQLALDDYARYMSIPGWLFNQVNHPQRPKRGGCEHYWQQSGYDRDPNRIVGRDEIGFAVYSAEAAMANALGFWMGRKWFCEEEHEWPWPKRGYQISPPVFHTNWGYLESGGVEAYTLLTLYPATVVYTDEDGDGVKETATITYDATGVTVATCEIEAFPPDRDPDIDNTYEIRPLQRHRNGDIVTLTGPRWLFVKPEEWLLTDPIDLDDDPAFLVSVNLYRHYNDDSTQAQIRWVTSPENQCATTVCGETCQTACMSVSNKRIGQFTAWPATRSGASWASASWAATTAPVGLRAWYHTRHVPALCRGCELLDPMTKMAICRLTNIYLAEAPCGCTPTQDRYVQDREEMEMTSYDIAMAMALFGTTARGAVFAYSVVKNLKPIGRGG